MKKNALPTPGWYPAPDGAPLSVYWDGTQWTDQTRPGPSLAQLHYERLAAIHRTRAASHRQAAQAYAALSLMIAVIVLVMVVVASNRSG